jgi:hypothetical protein
MAIYILKNGERQGPYEESIVAGWLMNGICSPQDLAWRNGMKDWQPLSAIPLLQLKPQSGGSGGVLMTIFGGLILAGSIILFLFSQFIQSRYQQGWRMNVSYEAAQIATTLGGIGIFLGLASLVAGIITGAIRKR